MTSPSGNVARRYFDALGAHDLDAALACWRPGGVDRLVGQAELLANGATIAIEGCDVVAASGDLIDRNDACIDSGDIARQLGMLPPAGSAAEARLTKLANLRTRISTWIHGTGPEEVAEGVWVVAAGSPPRR